VSDQYFEEKAKEFYELRLGSMSMKELCNKFLSLLRYVPYLIDEKPKIQRFLSCLPTIYKDRIEYDDPRTLEEATRKANFCFDQNNNKREVVPNWKNKNPNNYEQRRKNFRPNKNFNNSINFQKSNNYAGNNYKNNGQKGYFAAKIKETPKSNDNKANIKCWICNESNYARDCPQNRKKYINVNTVQEEATVGDVARETPRISAALENRQADHQTFMVEIEEI